ncbi:MAG TPA: carboxypeptidase regulatory-like domain-containing protein [Polyangiaceae bacterium]|nr:carboxypeptidase regulatory-like domain-containing protein [Polyangiaceae bacterium]
MVRSWPQRAREIPMLLFSVLACLLLVAGLVDSRRVRVEWVQAAPAPVEHEERDATLTVAVRAKGGSSIPGATVQAFWERDQNYYWAGAEVSDDRGQARLEELPSGSSWILVDAPGKARVARRVMLTRGEQHVDVELDVEDELSVRVTDEEGARLPRATVLVTTRDPLPFGALTDARGEATLGRLPPGPWTVKVSAPGYESIEQAGASGVVDISLRRLGSLHVEVKDPHGKPAANATVAIAGASLWPARRTQTDEQGVARIAGLLAGSYDLQASLGTLVSDPMIGFELERGAEASLVLHLEAGRMVTAIVTEGEGPNPLVVPGAEVVLAEGGLGSFPLRGRTGSDGKVTLGPISLGPATLAARAREFVGGGVVPVPDVLEEPVRVALLRGGTLRGEVVDSRGFPVDGASIEVVGTDLRGLPVAETPLVSSFRSTHFAWSLSGPVPLIPAGELGVMPGPVPPIPAPGAAPAPPGRDHSAAPAPDDFEIEPFEPWVSSSDGSFVARPVTPGRVRALVRHPAYVEGASELVSLAPGGEAEVRVVLLQGGTLEGRVVDDRGDPVADAEIEISAQRGSMVRATLTATDGRFEFAAVPAEVIVSVTRREDIGRVALRKTLRVGEGERAEVELVLPAAREPVRILVEDPDGQPLELAEISALSLAPDVPLRSTLFSDEAGEAVLDDAAGLPLRVTVRAPGSPTVTRSWDAVPEEITFTLSPGVLVKGSVTAVRGRVRVDQALVTLMAAGERKSALTNEDGVFELRDVPPGKARLLVSHPEYAEAELTVNIERTERVDRAFELDPVDLEEGGEIEGVVVDGEDEPVTGARVSLGTAASYLPVGALPRGTAVSDGEGRFSLKGVRPGMHRLEAIAAVVGRGSSAAVEVRGGSVTDGVRIVLSTPVGDDDALTSGGVAVTLGERRADDGVEVVVVQVAEGSEAERGGLQAGDVILAVDGQEPANMADARVRLGGPAGSDVVVEVDRDGAEVRLRVAREAVRR